MADEKQEETKKVKRPTSLKREEQNTRKKLQNRAFRSRVRTTAKGFLESLKSGDAKQRMSLFSELASMVDKGVNRHIFTRNKASRIKARMAARLAQA